MMFLSSISESLLISRRRASPSFSLCSPNEQKLRRKRQVKTRVRDQEEEEKHMPQSEQLEVLVLGSEIFSFANRLTKYVDINMSGR
jgi:hypothetical protein